jgi:hypothetical protein
VRRQARTTAPLPRWRGATNGGSGGVGRTGMGMRAWHLLSALRGDAGRGMRMERIRRNWLWPSAVAIACAMHRCATEIAMRSG